MRRLLLLVLCGCGVSDPIGVQRAAVGKPDMVVPAADLALPAEDLSGADFAGVLPDLTPGAEADLLGPTCAADAECDDVDACTNDLCDPTTHTCTHVAVTGCCSTDSDCAGGPTVCQIGKCAVGSHSCGVETVAGCCMADSDCVADQCMTATCANNSCQQAPVAGCTPGTASGKSGCGCTVGRAPANDAAALAFMLLLAVAVVCRIASRRRS
jgi:hypothetical protein